MGSYSAIYQLALRANLMQYPNGETAHIGDKVKLWTGAEGTIVCSMDTAEYPKSYPESEWGYLKHGVLISSPEAGLIHYNEPEHRMELISRGSEEAY